MRADGLLDVLSGVELVDDPHRLDGIGLGKEVWVLVAR